MSYDAAVNELRQLLADTEFNKKATNKRLIGSVNGENATFYSYDKKLIESTLEVYVDNESAAFTLNNDVAGQIILSSAPDINSKVQANYYWMFWRDEEIKNFLNKGAELVSQTDDVAPDTAYLQIVSGLKTPALYFSANMAFKAQIAYMINRRHSEEFLIEQDGNDDDGFSKMIEAMRTLSNDYYKQAVEMRDSFYKGRGRENKLSFGIKRGVSRQYGPKR